jgi:hypothetical protein
MIYNSEDEYSSPWDWFQGKEVTIIKNEHQYIDYHSAAKDKHKCIKMITEDPNVLFEKVICESQNMGWGLYDYYDEYEDTYVTFLELILSARTLNEADFVDLERKGVALDWRRIGMYAPLSIQLLEDKKQIMDWLDISKNRNYVKNKEFILQFREHLHWDFIGTISIKDDRDIEELVFEKKIIPLKCAVMKRLLTKWHIENYCSVLEPYMEDLLKILGIKEIARCKNWDSNIKAIIAKNPQSVRDACVKDRYVSFDLMDILANTDKGNMGYWCDIVNIYKSSMALSKSVIDMLEKYIIPNANNTIWISISTYLNVFLNKTGDEGGNEGWNEEVTYVDDFMIKYADKILWNFITCDHKLKIKFQDETWCMRVKNEWRRFPIKIILKYLDIDEEFIELHANEINWHELCEYQELSEYILRKYQDKLDWGQVSWYQPLSWEFIQEFRSRLNEIKLNQNKSIGSDIKALL